MGLALGTSAISWQTHTLIGWSLLAKLKVAKPYNCSPHGKGYRHRTHPRSLSAVRRSSCDDTVSPHAGPHAAAGHGR